MVKPTVIKSTSISPPNDKYRLGKTVELLCPDEVRGCQDHHMQVQNSTRTPWYTLMQAILRRCSTSLE